MSLLEDGKAEQLLTSLRTIIRPDIHVSTATGSGSAIVDLSHKIAAVIASKDFLSGARLFAVKKNLTVSSRNSLAFVLSAVAVSVK